MTLFIVRAKIVCANTLRGLLTDYCARFPRMVLTPPPACLTVDELPNQSLGGIIMKNVIAIFVVLLVSSGVSAEGTPDGLPPPLESVCDAEPAPGRGLCVAYCEAMDCADDPNANQSACNNVKARWQSKTGGTELPCEMSCPCNDIPGYLGFTSGNTPADSCEVGGGQFVLAGEGAIIIVQAGSCVYSEVGVKNPEIIVLPITADERVACQAGLVAAAEAQGLSCQADPL